MERLVTLEAQPSKKMTVAEMKLQIAQYMAEVDQMLEQISRSQQKTARSRERTWVLLSEMKADGSARRHKAA